MLIQYFCQYFREKTALQYFWSNTFRASVRLYLSVLMEKFQRVLVGNRRNETIIDNGSLTKSIDDTIDDVNGCNADRS